MTSCDDKNKAKTKTKLASNTWHMLSLLKAGGSTKANMTFPQIFSTKIFHQKFQPKNSTTCISHPKFFPNEYPPKTFHQYKDQFTQFTLSSSYFYLCFWRKTNFLLFNTMQFTYICRISWSMRFFAHLADFHPRPTQPVHLWLNLQSWFC